MIPSAIDGRLQIAGSDFLTRWYWYTSSSYLGRMLRLKMSSHIRIAMKSSFMTRNLIAPWSCLDESCCLLFACCGMLWHLRSLGQLMGKSAFTSIIVNAKALGKNRNMRAMEQGFRY